MNNYLKSQKEVENLLELYQLASTENNKDVIDECEKNLNLLLSEIKITETKCFLSNENDSFDSYLEIHAGAGGTESQDWASMLRRMYMKWADKKDVVLIAGKGHELKQIVGSDVRFFSDQDTVRQLLEVNK